MSEISVILNTGLNKMLKTLAWWAWVAYLFLLADSEDKAEFSMLCTFLSSKLFVEVGLLCFMMTVLLHVLTKWDLDKGWEPSVSSVCCYAQRYMNVEFNPIHNFHPWLCYGDWYTITNYTESKNSQTLISLNLKMKRFNKTNLKYLTHIP